MRYSVKKVLCVILCVLTLVCVLSTAVGARGVAPDVSEDVSVLDGVRDGFIGLFQDYWELAHLDDANFWSYMMLLPGVLLYVMGIFLFSAGDILLLPLNIILDHFDVI